MTHLKIGTMIFRTPLGGFINHSDEPNCEKVELRMTNQDTPGIVFDYKKWNLVTLKDIKKGKELTLKYTFYNINDTSGSPVIEGGSYKTTWGGHKLIGV